MTETITGTISYGTLRTQDLLPTFLDTLRDIAPAHYEQLMVSPFGAIPAYAQEDDESEWWSSEDAADLLSELSDALDEHAPEGHCFGAHPGDGADFGFWPTEDD